VLLKRRGIVIRNSNQKHFALTQKRSEKKMGIWGLNPKKSFLTPCLLKHQKKHPFEK